MRNKIIAALFVLKVAVLGTWFIATLLPFSSEVVSAGLPPEPSAVSLDKEDSPPSTEKGLILAIQRKDRELRTREEELNERMAHLVEVRIDIETKIKELKELIKEFDAVKERIDTFNNNKAKRLVKIYESMAPQSAAARIERLEDTMAASILGSMKEKIAGKILGFINVEKSVKISRVLKKDIR